MLSEQTIATVKATVPVLQEHGETITRHFYERMFKQNPEVLPYFNPINQEAGAQQHALASAICGYAASLDNLQALTGAVDLIANKHASLRVRPEHYPIVGENLLAAIREVLGEGANDDVMTAWEQAYGVLANILIDRESEIYKEHERTPGGWSDFKNFTIIKKEKENDLITSFYLKPEDGLNPPLYKAGQYITVRIPSQYSYTTMRNYSLSDKPGQDYFRISVKRDDSLNGCPMGYVSNHLHNHSEEGQALEVGPPCGDFYLRENQNNDRPLVLLAAGVGITPLMSMLLTALENTPQRQIFFIHAALDEKTQAFRQTIDALAEKHSTLTRHYRYSEKMPDGVLREQAPHISEGFVDSALLQDIIKNPDADFYFCGPKPFMTSVYCALKSWDAPMDQVYFEFFGPKQEIEDA